MYKPRGLNMVKRDFFKKWVWGIGLMFVIAFNNISGQTHPLLRFDTAYSGLNQPIDITNAGDGSDRLFVVERPGRIRIIENGILLPDNFLDITSKVSTNSERGLLGLAFHPQYQDSGYFYVHYSDIHGDTQISRFKRDPQDANKADTSEASIILIDQPRSNHNGGTIKFGPDGYLYIGMGDGGGAEDPDSLSQNGLELLGKMLRLDIDNGLPYSVPTDNPFLDSTSIRDEIWAIGLRNPFRFSFDKLKGDLWIADVGQYDWEEVNIQSANSLGGENYGWRCYEGNHEFNTSGCLPPEKYVFPIYEEPHPQGSSITGGFVYRGSNPCLYGVYIGADYNRNTIHTIIPDGQGGWSADSKNMLVRNIAGFGEDESGDLYAVSLSQGLFYKIEGADVYLDQNPIDPGTYFSSGKILSSGTIVNGDSLSFVASQSVELVNQFEVESGGILGSMIGCGNDQE